MASEKTIREICEEKARKGDGAFAIAAALFDLSDSQEATAKALTRLGLGNASTHFGALENLAMELDKAGQSLSQAIDGIGQQIGTAISARES